MSPETRRRRILLALDAYAADEGSLEAAFALAADMQAELEALFIEDDALFHLCGLPGAAVSLSSGALTRLEVAGLERDLRARAAAARRRLEALAQARRVTYSFTVTRGRVREVVGRAAAGSDVVAVSRAAAASVRSRRAPVLAAIDAAETGAAVLRVAARVAERLGTPLVVLAPADDFARLRGLLAPSAGTLHVELRALPAEATDLCQAVQRERGRLLVLRAGDDAAQILARFPDSEVWLVRD